MRYFKPKNYDENPCEFMVYVEPKPQKTENRELIFESVRHDYKYAQYWSNNWRKVHGYPLIRKQERRGVLYLKPVLISEERTTEVRKMKQEVDEYLESQGYTR